MQSLPVRPHSVATVIALSALCPTAFADVVLTLNDFTVGNSSPQLLASPSTSLSGVVTGVSIDAILTQASAPNIQARYAMVYFGAPIAGFLATVGYVTNPFPYPLWQNPQWSPWPNGASGDPGTPLSGRVDFSQPFSASSVSSLGMTIPNASNGEWLRLSGTLTLHGVDLVPTPGAIALLGLAGLGGSRRRR